jgi:hypothetical protein
VQRGDGYGGKADADNSIWQILKEVTSNPLSWKIKYTSVNINI